MITTNTLSDLGITHKSRILMVMPHPDDEAIFAGGFLHKLAKHHIPTRLITMSAGEKSTLRHKLHPSADLAKERRGELAGAMKILRIFDYHVYNFPDGGMPMIKEKMSRTIAKEMRTYRPTHTVSLEPDGVYGHPDHIALSAAAKLAVKKPVRLLYVTVAPHYTASTPSKNMAKKKTIRPITPEIELRLSLRDAVAKVRSLWAHKSQFQAPPKALTQDVKFFLKNSLLKNEYFTFGN